MPDPTSPMLPSTVYTVTPDTTILDAAVLMAERNVGDVVVVEDLKPVGIVTDRDIAVKGVAAGWDIRLTPVSMIMSRPLITITEDQGVGEAIALMSRHAIRRLPIVDGTGRLASILTLDDLLLLDLDGRDELTRVLRQQLRAGTEEPPAPPRAEIPPAAPPATPPEPPPAAAAPEPAPAATAPEPLPAAPTVEDKPLAAAAPALPAAPAPSTEPVIAPKNDEEPPPPPPSFIATSSEAEVYLEPRPAPVRPQPAVPSSRPVSHIARAQVVAPLPRRHLHRSVHAKPWFSETFKLVAFVLVLSLLGALVALATIPIWRALYNYNPVSYEPKDEERQQYLIERQKERAREQGQ